MTESESELVLATLENDPKALKSDEQLADAIWTLVNNWESTLRRQSTQGADGAPIWMAYEHRIWALGESLRQAMKYKRKWRGKNALFDVVARVLCDKRFGKGRESFALLLGTFGRGEYGAELGSMLSDVEVQGHCIDALKRAKIGGFVAEAKLLAESHKHAWVRASARKYLENFATN